ncbi:hypothetical protein [Psychromarinibacter halotolerans]|uniref:Uncharacterized protein n=1 Tax=Psychromarinibacter halotolerans TaxID=1775175 RepID=A0ABV7GUS2_9RHOB|nr:hypothetical protein [Psychromarinibacter halotolerans]MDF0594625.1 hypothetical protein [Psychromarinibacter halotolerans]
MPAAKLSKASMANALDAIVAAGLTPGHVRVDPDGSFWVDIIPACGAIERAALVGEDEPEKFEDVK